MTRSLILALHLLLFITHITGWQTGEDQEDEAVMKRLLSRLEDGRLGSRAFSEVFSCRKLGESCRTLPTCCEGMTCYRSKGYSLGKDGSCVKCIKETNKCQRDGQCCGHLQCNRGNALWIDGTCQRYRRTGPCYRDGQCVNACVKAWYATQGTCS